MPWFAPLLDASTILYFHGGGFVSGSAALEARPAADNAIGSKIRELGLPRPAGAVLLWPYADFTFSGASIRTNADIDMLPVRDLAGVWGPAYVGSADPTDPLVSPALADLTDLPPLLIIAGGAEALLSCAERIATNARLAGVETQFSVYPDKVHGWMLLPKLAATVAAVAEIRTWIAAQLGGPRSSSRPPGRPS